ncbi:voltage-gated potassium channel subunit beta-1 [Spodoptera litura]|uniref:Voltage-gated potassium channel subunit beta-1 n=1 Tax=Spodoptera litura TaxID=69820 RepID=A0A9J7EQJ9_SPOLT|nr:voltage-gated potassium channel subunit beta-1 [Spodoptera litura]
MAHQFWISYHPPTGNKHASSGDETPPIPEEELEQQKLEHEKQLQKEKECQAREAEEIRQLDIKLLHQRAIEAEEDKKREIAEAVEGLRGMNTSWSHHRLCDLQRQAARLHHSRPSIPDTTKYQRNMLRKSCSTQLTKPESSQSIDDGIILNFSRFGPCRDASLDSDCGSPGGCVITVSAECNVTSEHHWQNSTVDISSNADDDLGRPPSCQGCRAPIASLDCMDDFSANSQQMLDQAGEVNVSRHMSTYMGNHTTMPSVVTPGLRYKNLGKSGLRVPNIGLGIWAMLNEDCAEDVIMTALENGINLFDLSEAHCAKGEAELGRVLKKRNVRRTSVIITTKVYWSTKSDERGLSRKHIVESVKSSLSRLQMEYIDVVLLHKVDPVCPMEELVRAMNFVINQGWVMYWGTARWTPAEIMDAYSNCRQFNCITPIVEQTEYHMFCREKPELYMPELYHKIGVGMMAWSAITTGKGLGREEITGLFAKSRFNRKYSTFSWCEEDLAVPEDSLQLPISSSKDQVTGEEPRTYGDKLRDLSNLANTLNCSMSQLAVAWCLKNESVNCLLLGATSVEQFKENIHALQIVPQLTPIMMIEIERLLANKPQRPPMVSTLAMRNQQNNNTVRVDMTGATTSGTGSPKPEGDVVDAEASTPSKEPGRGFCEIQ